MGIIGKGGGSERDALIAGLERGDAYGRPEQRVEHIETHISHVFLVGEHAYKIKKPLDLGFLDFSSLAKRRAACEEELRINRRLSPDLYVRVVAIAGPRSAPRVEGEGAPIEYAVEMRRFDQNDLLEAVLARGALTGALIDALAARVADFHASIPRADEGSEYGCVRAIVAPAEQNFEQLAQLLTDRPSRAILQRLRDWTARQHDALRPLFEARQRDGFVRECHGDLHLGNLVLIGGSIRIFDAIEFNAALRWVDVMSEVAFLAMDLRLRGRNDLAARFLNVYLEASGDYAGVRLLAYYTVYRALVRAKVAAMRARQTDAAAQESKRYRAKCDHHLAFADRSARGATPILVILHGPSGSGKTACSVTLVEEIDAIRIKSDVERKRLHAMTAATRSGAGVGNGIYSEAVSERTYAHLLSLTEQMLRAGQSVIVDAAFLRSARRSAFQALAAHLQIPFAIASFTAPEAALRSRIQARAREGHDASDADIAVLEHQLRTLEPLNPMQQRHCVIFDTSTASAAEVASRARELLKIARVPQRSSS